MELLIFSAGCTGDEKNCLYPNRHVVTDVAGLIEVVKKDHVCAMYKNNYRNGENFILANTLVMDMDNDHTEEPDKWLTQEKLGEIFSGVSYALASSRHHMKVKKERAARPKYHLYFQIPELEAEADYVALKRAVAAQYSFFDTNALDSARFIYGNDTDEVVWHEGFLTIDEMLLDTDVAKTQETNKVIPEGRRNKTLSLYAARIVKRFGVSEKAKELFERRADMCEPPMEAEELNTIWHSACKFGKKVQGQEGYVDPKEYNTDFSGNSLKPDDFSDIGQAKVLAHEYAEALCYTDAMDYLCYDGEVWIESKQMAVGAMEEFLDLQLEDANEEVSMALDAVLALGQKEEEVIAGGKKYESGLTGDVLKAYKRFVAAAAYRNFVMKRRDMKYVMSALQAAKPMLQVDIADLDKDEFLLNAPGITIDLRKGVAGGKEPEASDYITKQTTVVPGEEGKQLWMDALNTFFCKDKELISYVQKIVGLASIGKVYVEALIIAYGEGRNGKSTFWNSISRVLGTYSGTISSDALTIGCRRNVKPEMAELKGRRLIITSELEEGMRLNNSIVKQICSTDEIQAEKKFKDPFKFIPSHTVVLYTNHLPKVGANDAGIWRRLIVIPFNAKIEGKSDIKNYTDYLVRNAGPAILSWIIEGAKKVMDEDYKFKMPACVSEAVEAYRGENDWLGHFLEECCDVSPSLEQKSGEFYQEYRNYCARNGEYTRGTTDFYSAIEKMGFTRKKKNSGIWVQGLQIKLVDFLD